MNEPKYFVIRKRDDAPVEVYPYDNFDEAEKEYDFLSEQWSDCYFCTVIKPQRN